MEPERTLFVIKPDAVARGLAGAVISRLEARGFSLARLAVVRFTREQAEEFYAPHAGKPFFGELASFMASGPAVAGVVEGRNAVKALRSMVGATMAYEAAPGSIRGDMSLGITDNVIHASDSARSFEREESIAFR